LGFEELQGVEAEMRIRDLETLAQNRAGLILHKEEAAVRFVPGDLLHNVQVVDGGEEVAEGEDGDWLLGRRCGRIA
jgi:hypothetical protein